MRKLLAIACATVAFAVTAPAQALVISYSDIVTGYTPDSPAPYLTVTITNVGGGGVDIALQPGVISPEFITAIYFSLNDPTFSADEPITDPDLDLQSCNGRAPAGTGPWQLCVAFDPNDHAAWPDSISFFVSGLTESNFVFNTAGWISVAHVQGIQPNCSGWVGSFSGDGRRDVSPGGDGQCASTSVPEPATLGLLGLGLAGLGLVRRRNVG